MLIALLSTLIILCAILLISFLWERRKCLRMQKRLFRESRKLEHTNHVASAILKNVHAFILLINNDFKVLKTNYYQQTGTRKGPEEKRVGDLLQCRNALSAEGGCGTHVYCGSCPIRQAIRQAFEQRRGFTDLNATLNVLTSEKKSVECDAVISGSYFLLNEEENMVLTVHDITQLKQAEKQLALAKEKAEEAVSDVIGVMTSASDAAYSKYNDGMNPYYRVTSSWNEIRISANITSYLSGYNDPRLAKYASEADASIGGGQIGVRNGIYQSATTQANYTKFSRVNIGIDDELLIMSASEAYFLRAEAALMYKWNMGGTPKELYDTGVTVSMEERKATIGDYLKSEKVPAAYSDPSDSGKDIAAVSTVTPKYNESASVTENLERILIQKWIANFPNGWETWADSRRTGYPKLFPIVNNLNTDGVTVQRGMRRLPFPQSEYNTNNANVKAAVSMLGGADNSATDLWWAKKN